ncbi:hypothetical protein BDW59DRAFT_102563 [Aspergillus cavernicola]|uniref:Uncharacterized protein n=1 Tax=Aspergillus cavernicola TaxID=176166 RepID=A0ABR4I3H4_9EURO
MQYPRALNGVHPRSFYPESALRRGRLVNDGPFAEFTCVLCRLVKHYLEFWAPQHRLRKSPRHNHRMRSTVPSRELSLSGISCFIICCAFSGSAPLHS